MTVYKKIKNTTHQGLELVTKSPNGQYDHLWVPAKQSVVVPNDSITDLIRVAEQRQMIKITKA